MKIYKITEASAYLGVSINTLKTLANNGKINSFKTSGGHRRFRQDDLDSYMGVEKEKQEKLTPTEPPPSADGKHPLPVKPKEITQFNGGTNRPPTKPKSNRPPPATEPRNKEKDEPKLLKNIVSFKDIDGNYHYYRIDHFVSLSIPVKGNDLKVTFILVGDVMSYFYVDKPTGEHILQLFEEWSK